MAMPPLPPPPRRLLIVDRDRDANGAYLQDRLPNLEIRTAERTDLVAADLEWADAYLGFRPPPHLELDALAWVHCTGAGVDAYLFRRRFPAGTLLTRNDEPFGRQIGEWCQARALAVTQQLLPLAAAQARGEWAQRHLQPLHGSTVLIIGTGAVGQGIAAAFAAVGCVVHGVSATGRAVAPFGNVFPVSDLAERIAAAQVVILALPLTEATWHLVGPAALGAGRGAFLMNVGRGALLDEASLLPALDAGHLSGVALDVFETEPLPPDSPLWADPRVIVSPHMAGITTVAGAGESFLQVYHALARGESPGLAVDPARGY